MSGVAFGNGLLGNNAKIKVWAAFGADLTDDPLCWVYTDITAAVLYAGSISITPMGRADEASQPQPAGCSFKVWNGDGGVTGTTFAEGDFTAYNPASQFYPYLIKNTPIKIEINLNEGVASDILRFQGYANGWVPDEDSTGNSATVSVSASGITRRLGQGQPPSLSPIRRSTSAARPIVYAPMEEDASADGLSIYDADGNVVGSCYIAGTLSPGSGQTGLPGTLRSVQLGADTNLRMDTGLSPAPSESRFAGKWQVDWFMYASALPATEVTPMRVWINDPVVSYVDFRWGGGSNWGIKAFGPAGLVQQAMFTSPASMITGWIHARIMAQNSATGVDFQLVTFPAQIGSGGGNFAPLSIATAKVGNPQFAEVPAQADMQGISMCHWAIYPRYDYSAVDSSGSGYNNETLAARLTRVCAEENIPLTIVGSTSIRMGPQDIDLAINVLRECEKADGGALLDGLGPGLTYICHAERYNLTPTLTLDAVAGEVGKSLASQDDDQRSVNQSTASRESGGSARVAQTDGPLGISTIGLYDKSDTYNVSSDTYLDGIASWIVHLGQAEGFRYPNFEIDILAAAQITGATTVATGWLDMVPTAGRLDVTNLHTVVPSRPPGDVRLLVEGWSEVIDPLNWTIAGNCSLYDPWEVSTVEDVDARLDCGASALVSTPSTSSTSFEVAVADICSWAHDDGDYPITVGGEVVTVTAVTALAGSTPTFGAAGTAATGNGSAVQLTPGLPSSVSAGNLLLMFASCRDTNATDCDLHVVSPNGGINRWKRLRNWNQMALFGKIATASETAPTVTIDSTVTGDSAIAQIARFSGKWADADLQLIAEASISSPAGTNDIAYPGLTVPLSSCLIVVLGWKADDWTSVATLSGMAEISEATTTLGNDAGQVWDYVYSAAATTIPTGTFTVTGGVTSVISKGAVVAFRTATQTMTVTRAQRDTIARAHLLGEEVHVTDPIIPSRE